MSEWLRFLLLYATGTLGSSLALGIVLGTLGSAFPTSWHSLAFMIVAALGFLLALADLNVAGATTPTFRRQTCPAWSRTLGWSRTVLLWGLDLGLGFTTIRLTSLYWVVVLVAFVNSSPLVGAFILGGYGFALAFNLCVGILFLEHKGTRTAAYIQALRLARPLKTSMAVFLIFWCIFLFVFATRGV